MGFTTLHLPGPLCTITITRPSTPTQSTSDPDLWHKQRPQRKSLQACRVLCEAATKFIGFAWCVIGFWQIWIPLRALALVYPFYLLKPKPNWLHNRLPTYLFAFLHMPCPLPFPASFPRNILPPPHAWTGFVSVTKKQSSPKPCFFLRGRGRISWGWSVNLQGVGWESGGDKDKRWECIAKVFTNFPLWVLSLLRSCL